MRAALVITLVALSSLAVGPARSQTTPATATAPPHAARGGDITRDDYIERAVERAKTAAGKRFDKMDANHDGVLTADERAAARAERAAARAERHPKTPQ